jgi:RNA 2',3'-cyclic 3'-phosphodiesterase
MTVLRVFVALWPPVQVAQALADAATAAIRTKEGRDLRPTAPHRIHLTCAFLGDVSGRQVGELADHLVDVAATSVASDLSLDRAGHFGDHVLWAAPAEPFDDLKALAKSVRIAIRSAGLSVQGSEFRPHLTVARTRQDAALAPLVDRFTETLSAEPIRWHADDLCLVSSVRAATATYEVLERWQLPYR